MPKNRRTTTKTHIHMTYGTQRAALFTKHETKRSGTESLFIRQRQIFACGRRVVVDRRPLGTRVRLPHKSRAHMRNVQNVESVFCCTWAEWYMFTYIIRTNTCRRPLVTPPPPQPPSHLYSWVWLCVCLCARLRLSARRQLRSSLQKISDLFPFEIHKHTNRESETRANTKRWWNSQAMLCAWLRGL